MLAYLIWLAVFVWSPLFVLWAGNREILRKHMKTLAVCVAGALAFAVPWDSWATATGMWSFPSDNVIGVYVINLPIEEYLFIIFVTLLGATATLVLRERFLKPKNGRRSES
jgi:lycopene cyclase domain-containing protein